MTKTIRAWGILSGRSLVRPSVRCTRRDAVLGYYRGTGRLPVDPEADLKEMGNSVVRPTITFDDGRKR